MSELESFRRARGLLSGDDLAAWLEAAGMSEPEWRERVAAGRTADLPGALPVERPRTRAGTPAAPAGPAPPQVWMDRPDACADAALRVVAAVRGVEVPADVAAPPRASLEELVATGRALGLPARALKASRRRVHDLPAPWIAHVDGGHWIVVHSVRDAVVTVSDPARGAGTLALGAFLTRWSGWCAVFAPAVHCD